MNETHNPKQKLSNGQLYYGLVIILLVLNGFMLQAASSNELLHSFYITNIQLVFCAGALAWLLRERP